MLWDVYEEHLEEAAFLWGQWERAMNSANHTLDEVADGPEERLRAHLDGLVLGGGPVAEKLLVPALGHGDEGMLASAAWALLRAEHADCLDLVFVALSEAKKKEEQAAFARAFVLADRAELADRLRPRLEKSAPPVQAVIVDVLATRLTPSPSGKPARWEIPVETFLESRHQDLRAATLRGLCRAPDPMYQRLVEKLLESPYVNVRDAAIAAGLHLGARAVRPACGRLIARNAAGARLPLGVLAVGGEAVDVTTIIRKLEVRSMRRDALWALGFAGTVQAAEAVLAWIADEEVGKVAGESFATITGARIVGALAEVGRTDNSAPPEDGDDDAPVQAILPEDNLAAPHAQRVLGWWGKVQSRFAPDARYLYGQPLSPQTMQSAVREGPMWRRRVWNLALAEQGAASADIDTWARRQRGQGRVQASGG